MSHTVSVVIPVYNRQDYLEECVESVFNQSYSDFEIILIDDGSTDNSVAICKEIASRDSRVVFLESGHLGVSGARNLGLDAATGEFVFFLDSDDVLHPDIIKVLVNALDKYGADVGGTRSFNLREANWKRVDTIINEPLTESNAVFKSFDDTLEMIFFGSNNPYGTLGGTIIRRSIIGDTRFSRELSIGEDFYFVYQNIIKGVNTVLLNGKCYVARIHSSNTSWNYTYDGFYTRFLRRKLVWESEQAAGRERNAKKQKRDGFNVFVSCVTKNKPYSADAKRMRQTVRAHSKELFAAQGAKTKFTYLVFMHFPMLANALFNVKHRSKAAHNIITCDTKSANISEENLNTLKAFLGTSIFGADEVFARFSELDGAKTGCGKNPLEKYVYVPGTRKDRVLLVAHTDTVWDKEYNNPVDGEPKLVFEEGIFSSGNKNCGIGADDRAGCAMLWALKNSGHSLLLVGGEEHGKHGARFLKSSAPKLYKEINSHKFMIEFDWVGSSGCLYNGVLNSEKFKDYINKELNVKEDRFKGGCDLSILCKDICGVNLGVGYHKHHTAGEYLSASEWQAVFEEASRFLEKEHPRFKIATAAKVKNLASRAFKRVFKRK